MYNASILSPFPSRMSRYLFRHSRRLAPLNRQFSTSQSLREIRSILELPDRILPAYRKSSKGLHGSKLLLGVWPDPGPKNVLLVMKSNAANVRAAAREFAHYVKMNYPEMNLIFERDSAISLESEIAQPIYTLPSQPTLSPFPFTQATDGRTPVGRNNPSKVYGDTAPSPKSNHHPDIFEKVPGDPFHEKTDLVLTLGGDGTILHAASLFSTARVVPPMLSFSMGSLGFLGECHWKDHVKAFLTAIGKDCPMSKGYSGEFAVLRRGRLKVGVFNKAGMRVAGDDWTQGNLGDVHVMNEVNIHRGAKPHLAIVEVFVAGRKLTEAVADGMIISTPTGSTAYSLSSGGAIVHPAVNSLLLTPICPRSLSFRPLVLPTDTIVTLRLSNRNRSSEVEVSVDGKKWGELKVNEEIRVWGEEIRDGEEGGWGGWEGGIPCVKISTGDGDSDGWVGGLNGLLKFNYPFGEEEL